MVTGGVYGGGDLGLIGKRNRWPRFLGGGHTKTIAKQLQLDMEKHNGQYPKARAIVFKDAHDHFMIVDGKQVYHIGAFIKDLGKNWFAFTQLQADAVSIINKIKAL